MGRSQTWRRWLPDPDRSGWRAVMGAWIVLALLAVASLPARDVGAAEETRRCSHCQRTACPRCRVAEGGQTRHRQCAHGLCPANCPVRPDVFGFYGTQWRRWPGEGSVAASDNEAATPARPPRAEVPEATEEAVPEQQPESGTEPAAEPAASPAVAPAADPAIQPQSGVRRSTDAADAEALPEPARTEPDKAAMGGPDKAAAGGPDTAAIGGPNKTAPRRPDRAAADTETAETGLRGRPWRSFTSDERVRLVAQP